MKIQRICALTATAALISTIAMPARVAAQGRDRITSANLLRNGGFEDGVRGSRVPGWAEENSKAIELTWESNQALPFPAAFEGEQFVELDATTNTGIYQDIATVPGEDYYLSFAYRNRTGANSSSVVALINGNVATTVNTEDTATWHVAVVPFTSQSVTTRVTLRGNGTSDGVGDLVDAVTVFHAPQIILPQFADGGGWTTTITVMNPNRDVAGVDIRLFGADPRALTSFFLQPGETRTYVSPNTSNNVSVGWVQVVEQVRGMDLAVSARYRYLPAGSPSSEAVETGIAPTRATGHLVSTFNNKDGYSTGLALANPMAASKAYIFIEGFTSTGAPVQQTVVSLAERGHSAFFLREKLPAMANLEGSIKVWAARVCAPRDFDTCVIDTTGPTVTTVWYGAGTKWVSRKATGSIACSPAAFGIDPAPNVPKSCYVRGASEFAVMGVLSTPSGTFTSLPY